MAYIGYILNVARFVIECEDYPSVHIRIRSGKLTRLFTVKTLVNMKNSWTSFQDKSYSESHFILEGQKNIHESLPAIHYDCHSVGGILFLILVCHL